MCYIIWRKGKERLNSNIISNFSYNIKQKKSENFSLPTDGMKKKSSGVYYYHYYNIKFRVENLILNIFFFFFSLVSLCRRTWKSFAKLTILFYFILLEKIREFMKAKVSNFFQNKIEECSLLCCTFFSFI